MLFSVSIIIKAFDKFGQFKLFTWQQETFPLYTNGLVTLKLLKNYLSSFTIKF